MNDTVNKPSILSISWGGPESSWTAQSLQSFNSVCRRLQPSASACVSLAATTAQPTASTDGLDHVDFPASSPYALACGGTTLKISGSTISSEVVWNDLSSNDGATGGGVSGTFPLPTWQANANVPPSTNPSGYEGRGMPDVAGDADPAPATRSRRTGKASPSVAPAPWRPCGRDCWRSSTRRRENPSGTSIPRCIRMLVRPAAPFTTSHQATMATTRRLSAGTHAQDGEVRMEECC